MIRFTRGAACLAIALGTLAPAAKAADEKWVSLFDGKTLSGWEMVELPGKKSEWKVVDGTLAGSGEPSMLYSPRGDYKNFRFRAEIKISDKANSGMYFRTPKEATFSKGYECQVNSSHTDPIRTGSIYTFVHVFKQHVKPDTWFWQEVEVADVNYRGKVVTRIRVKVDNELLYEFLDHQTSWKTGHFAFQQHDPGSKVYIRKVEVMELPETVK